MKPKVTFKQFRECSSFPPTLREAGVWEFKFTTGARVEFHIRTQRVVIFRGDTEDMDYISILFGHLACGFCLGHQVVDSGGVYPDETPIMVPCPECCTEDWMKETER